MKFAIRSRDANDERMRIAVNDPATIAAANSTKDAGDTMEVMSNSYDDTHNTVSPVSLMSSGILKMT